MLPNARKSLIANAEEWLETFDGTSAAIPDKAPSPEMKDAAALIRALVAALREASKRP